MVSGELCEWSLKEDWFTAGPSAKNWSDFLFITRRTCLESVFWNCRGGAGAVEDGLKSLVLW